ncbi:MAG: metal-dependent hydrolase, partial [Bacteroidota bacterium]
MDSLTQVILGAATGEAAKGKKLGNKAMFWGAVGGTIPDLDVFVGAGLQGLGLVDEMWALAFHRGISHSIFFAVLAPFVLGPLVSWHYRNPNRKYVSFVGSLIVFGIVGFAINFVFYELGGKSINVSVLLGTLAVGGLLTWFFRKRYFERTLSEVDATWKDFAWVFFWSIFTHPLLDSCTTFGTQLFLPFSDYRVGFNNIAVADIFYTLPFLICLVTARLFLKNTYWRKFFLWAGISISSVYLLYTVYNKFQINQVFEKSLRAQGIQYQRFMTSPALFTNFLWSGTAEGEDVYYQALYSQFDKDPLIPEFTIFPKNHELISTYENDRSIKILKW